MDQRRLMENWKIYRKPVIAGVVVLGAAMLLLFSALTGGAYKVITFPQRLAKSNAGDIQGTTEQSSAQFGEIRNFALNVTRGALTESLKTEDATVFLDGLACVDAIGGPSPETVLNHLRSGLSDQSLIAQLDTIEKTISGRTEGRGAASCVSWLLRG